ncbi:Na+/H+ antiporter NhaC family protein [Wenzhouxiangella sp. XN79A]|uniref:Na+/H+ antiporter NhaC family protein n=1 Tax=Wenzhouxiangella sp. XN79A TaxID=2724193 RepID=UPI00144AB1EF|nr:Na+/H+ antiporter NhaC family protein [Wenzhouxiangella sp. XN79A]NKI34094.1 Na+/H+ antiporter NhaC family protein [Wenzhouxiangella sp. XN79A]
MTRMLVPAAKPLTFLALLLLPALATAQDAAAGAPDHAGWISLLPPLVAIGLALAIRQVIPALFAGVWIGAWAATGFSPIGLLSSLMETADTYIRMAIAEPDHASVMLFTLLVGGMVGVISRNGGMLGIVERIVVFADTTRRAMMATVGMGLAIFFDDYANTLVVGNTMRPITDRLKISREKLAYLVDSTAAPIACIALVTTWVGYEVGLIRDAMASIPGLDLNPYLVFLNSIAYSFYPLLALVLVFSVVGLGRDFGPMLAAERRARHQGQVAPPTSGAKLTADDMQDVQPEPHVRLRAMNAVLPILTLVFGVVAGMFVTGEGATIRDIVGSADPYKSLIWGSLAGSLVAIGLSMGQRILSLEDAFGAWFFGARAMLYAIVILVLAWALSGVTDVLGTAGYLVSLLGDSLHPGLLPALVFVLAAVTAFSTGSSWGTMGILLPLMVPLAWALMAAQGMDGTEHLPILYATVASVMGGAVWGDHCSPISDTTILSSMASQCDHIEHVRTQLPYALLAGGIALLFGALPAGFGVPWWIGLTAGAAVLVGIVRWKGRPA